MLRSLTRLAVLVSLVGCKAASDVGSAAALTTAGKPGQAAGLEPGGEATADKADEAWSHVTHAYNQIIRDVSRDVVDVYLGAVGKDAPAKSALADIRLGPLGVLFDRMLEDAKGAVAKAREAKSDLAVLSPADAMLNATAALGEAYRAAARYYGGQEFKTDAARSVALHQSMMAALEAWSAARAAVSAAL